MDHVSTDLKEWRANIFNFEGRARRRIYWTVILTLTAISLAISLVESVVLGTDFLGRLASLAAFVASLGVTVRRLHDTDRSGWWIAVVLIPFVGWLALLVITLLDSTRGPNRYGPDPKFSERSFES